MNRSTKRLGFFKQKINLGAIQISIQAKQLEK